MPRSERNAIRSPISVEGVKEVRKHITVLQSVRAGRFADVTVLGSQYRDHTGATSWYVAVSSEQNIKIRIYRLSGRELPYHVDLAHQQALLDAIRLWEYLPASQPN
jgi:hypothetical protein